MRLGRGAELAAISILATAVTVAIAAPVLHAPSERVFGAEIVGRHHDPFTVMQQFERPLALGAAVQPLTDLPGALLARLSGSVAAYNWVVLLSFPLAAAAAYLLARDLSLAPAGAAVAAMAYAFSPFHLSHAAYHPHIAQTQWMPLYLLALWRCVDRASPGAIVRMGAAAVAVTLSNFYGGLIAAVMTPVAIAAYWLTRPVGSRSLRSLGLTLASLALVAASGVAYAWYMVGPLAVSGAGFAIPPEDVVRHSARWWSYLVPPVEQPWVGEAVRRFWAAMGVREGLLEHQVSLGLGIIALGLLAAWAWLVDRRTATRAAVPLLVVVAIAAFVCSLAPEARLGPLAGVTPPALLHGVLPVFRAYARFGVVVQLMAALLAGIAIDDLLRRRTRRARIACVALVLLVAAEYAVLPGRLWRDVLPTTAHRWVMQQNGAGRVLDCTPLTQESQSVPWLTQNRVALLDGSVADCSEPNLPHKLAAMGYTHLIVRHDSADQEAFDERALAPGLAVAARFADARVFEVSSQPPAVYTRTMIGFFPREYGARRTWRWMGATAAWAIANTSGQPIVATLHAEVEAFPTARRMEVFLDGRLASVLTVAAARHDLAIGPLAIAPGDHELVFRAVEAPVVAGTVVDNGDWRPLAFAFGAWRWSGGSEGR